MRRTFPRRLLLKTLAASGVFLEAGCNQAESTQPLPQQHATKPPTGFGTRIQIENLLPGSGGFGLDNPALGAEVEAYASPVSVVAGDTVDVFVNTLTAQGARYELYRLGYYQGLGGRLICTGEPVAISPQPAPIPDPTTGLIECNWPIAFSIAIDPDWVTGYYLVKVTNEDGFETQALFIVRESGRVAPLLAQASVTTWQAYNNWGGISLYHNHTDQTQFAGPRGYRVSFDRPFLLSEQVWREELAIVRWLEEKGYDVAYITNTDVDAAPTLLNGRQLFLSMGHDEYWSLAARNAVQNARDQGLSIAFFSGNTAYRRIRLDNSSIGVERRIITCYKSATLDPHSDAPDTTADFAADPYPRPGIELLGLRWAGWAYLDGFPFIVTNPDHWIYEGTGVSADDSLGHVIGYEWDCLGDGAPEGLEVVGDSPVVHEYGYASRANATVFYPTATSFVFSAGTIAWGRALSLPGFVDARLRRVTQNILARAQLFALPDSVLPATDPDPPGTGDQTSVVAGTGSAGNVDGAVSLAQFNAPSGMAVGLSGELYVCDTGNHVVRKISADGQVSTVLGATSEVAKTPLSTPTGVVMDASGVLYVSDTNRDRIVAVDPNGRARIFAGGSAGNRDASNPKRATFYGPRGLAVGPSGALYVADQRNDSIRRIDGTGVTTVLTGAGGPTAIAVGPDETVYYVATWGGAIMSLSTDGTSRTLANLEGYGDQIGPGASAMLRPMDGLVFTKAGLVFSDTGNNRVRFIAFDDQNTVSNVLGNGQAGVGIGPGSATQVVLPRGLVAWNDGYAVADSSNHRILWFSLSVS